MIDPAAHSGYRWWSWNYGWRQGAKKDGDILWLKAGPLAVTSYTSGLGDDIVELVWLNRRKVWQLTR